MDAFVNAAAQEVITLHSLVKSWYRGDAEANPAQLERFLTHFHPAFSMDTPQGCRHGRDAFAKYLAAAYGTEARINITVDDIKLSQLSPDMAVVHFNEYRVVNNQRQVRQSTAVFSRGADGNPQWRSLKKTIIDSRQAA